MTAFIIFIVKSSFSCSGDMCWTREGTAFYVSLAHGLFVLGIMLVVGPTLEGNLPWLRQFLSWDYFRVMGRLTYSAYLIHLLVVAVYIVSSESTPYTSMDNIIFHYFGLYIMSYFAAFLLSLLVEVPFSKLEKCLHSVIGRDENASQPNEEIEFIELKNSQSGDMH